MTSKADHVLGRRSPTPPYRGAGVEDPPRSGREGKGALDLVFGLARWMLDAPDGHRPNGDTVDRSADDQVEVERVPPRGGAARR